MATNFVTAQVEKTYRSVTPAVHQVKASIMDGLLRLYEYAKLFAIGGVIAYLVVMRVDYAIALAIPAGFMCKWMAGNIREACANILDRYSLVSELVEKTDSTPRLLARVNVPVQSQYPDETVPFDEEDDSAPISFIPLQGFNNGFVDKARKCILDFLREVYTMDDKGEFINIKEDGQFVKGFRAPWSQRGNGGSQRQKRQMIDIVEQTDPPLFWLDEEDTRYWYVNLKDYDYLELAVEAIDKVPTHSM